MILPIVPVSDEKLASSQLEILEKLHQKASAGELTSVDLFALVGFLLDKLEEPFDEFTTAVEEYLEAVKAGCRAGFVFPSLDSLAGLSIALVCINLRNARKTHD